MVAGRLALAIPSNAVQDFPSSGPSDSWLGVAVHPAEVRQVAGRSGTFGLVVFEVEPGSTAANASLLPGDILLGTEEKPFTSIDDLSQILGHGGPRLERFEFLRGDYLRVRRVSVQLEGGFLSGSGTAA
jgi:S1-C subfamily serine protease